MEHLSKALKDCQFPNWALNKLQQLFLQKHNHNHNNNLSEEQTNNSRESNNGQMKNISIVIPYIQGLGERFKRTCNKQGIQVHFKGTNTVKQLLMAPKDKDPKLAKSGIIYMYTCPHINCTEQYIGESGRTLGDRYKEHLKAPSPIHLHTLNSAYKKKICRNFALL